MSVTINIVKNGKVVGHSNSRNLNGILVYARKHGVHDVTLHRLPGGRGEIKITFYDHSRCTTEFADYNVLVDWVKARRSWGKSFQLITEDT